MDTLAAWLRKTREAQGASLDQAADLTRIRLHLLQALEGGDFAALSGGEVQIRGFLRIYARYLGLPADAVLARYDSEVHGIAPAPEPDTAASDQPAEPPERMTAEDVVKTRGLPIFGSAPGWVTQRRAVVAVAGLIVVTAAVLGATGVLRRIGSAPGPTATATVSQAASPTETAATPASTPGYPIDPLGVVTVTLEATEHVWVRATTEDAVLLEGMMQPGETETWSGEKTISVETGNGAGLLVTVNGELLGRMSERRDLCHRAWAPWGEIDLTVP
jgi:cytoskeleton protein RodZ